MEFHQEQLNKCCRVCGKRLLKAKGKMGQSHIFQCSENATVLLEVFGIEVSSDNSTIHPQQFCLSCNSVARRRMTAIGKGQAYRGRQEVFNWLAHEEDCAVS